MIFLRLSCDFVMPLLWLYFDFLSLFLNFYYDLKKVQGKTLDFLTMSIACRPFPLHVDMKGFYVMISRVRSGDSLRVLGDARNVSHLRQLRHAPELAVWNASYSADGDWDAGLARENAKHAAARRPAPKRRAYSAAWRGDAVLA